MNHLKKLTLFIITIFFHNYLSQAQCNLEDWTALKALYESTDGNNWINNEGWNVQISNQSYPTENCNLSECNGVSLNAEGRVRVLNLSGNNLNGIIPSEINDLSNLFELNLSNNKLSESIPTSIGNLNNLVYLYLSGNELIGSIPTSIGNLSNLSNLYLSGNDLTGSIPDLSNLNKLRFLSISNNQLSGCYSNMLKLCFQLSVIQEVSDGNSFDASWEDFCNTGAGSCEQISRCHVEDWTALKSLYKNTDGANWPNNEGWDVQIANQNSPPANCNLGHLYGVRSLDNQGRVTSISLTDLNGNIPIEIEKLSNLISLDFSNSQLSSIPPELGNLINLTTLKLTKSALTGNIPYELGQLTNLQYLWLYYNQLTGEIPEELGNLKNLIRIDISENQLTGSIPNSFSQLSNLTRLNVSDNLLSGCYKIQLYQLLCDQISMGPEDNEIDLNNNFSATWVDFCNTGAGVCTTGETYNIDMYTNYSDVVSTYLTYENNQYHLKNNAAAIYDHSTCSSYTNLENCTPVTGLNNLAANEALWAITKAAEYFLTAHNIQIPPVNIFVNDTETPNGAKYIPSHNVLVLGSGDSIERNAMTAPDIVGHEYTHAVFNTLIQLGNYGIPGAINESYADIFGELIENYCYNINDDDWIYGSQPLINLIGAPNGLRNLSNPKDANMKYQLPNTYEGDHWIHIDNSCFHEDNCGVHTNSGVHSYWFYLLANGGMGINDNGESYNINGIGVEKAASLVFDNLINHLNPQSTIIDVQEGSICAAETLFGDQPNVLATTIEAWNAVGVYEPIENPIKFQISNSIQTGPEIIENGQTVIPVQFDLLIDSLGYDISGHELCFTLNLPDTYMEIYIETVYEPLSIDELALNKTDGEIKICINRLNNGANKKSKLYPLIASNSSILRFKVCIVSDDIMGEPLSIKPIEISGSTKIGNQEELIFRSATLPFGFDYDTTINNDPQSRLGLSLKLNHKNCNTLGALQIEVLNNSTIGVPPFTYSLKNISGIVLDEIENTNSTVHQFYNLEEGIYKVEVKDSNHAAESKWFTIKFVGEQTSSICCAEKLVIPAGAISGTFNSNGIISFSEGSYIVDGIFEICK